MVAVQCVNPRKYHLPCWRRWLCRRPVANRRRILVSIQLDIWLQRATARTKPRAIGMFMAAPRAAISVTPWLAPAVLQMTRAYRAADLVMAKVAKAPAEAVASNASSID